MRVFFDLPPINTWCLLLDTGVVLHGSRLNRSGNLGAVRHLGIARRGGNCSLGFTGNHANARYDDGHDDYFFHGFFGLFL